MSLHHARQQIDAYLDGEMTETERDNFLLHNSECGSCRAQVESRRNLLNAIRAARPEMQASDSLRRSVAAALERGAASRSSMWGNLLFPSAWLQGFRPRLQYAWLLFVALAAGLLFYLSERQQARADRLVDTAIDTHQRELAGTVPVEFRSASAADVTRWGNARLRFTFRLPVYQDNSSERSKYRLVGASLIPFRGKDAAYIAYRMGNEHISLVVVSTTQATASGGEITRAGSLIFHSVRKDGLQVFTWSAHHLTYALVSNVSLPPKQSCVVCHSNPKDHNWLQGALIHRSLSHGGNSGE